MNAGIELVVKPANIPEVRLPNEPPRAFAERMAREKARAVWAEAKGNGQCVLAADTVVAVGDLALGKPENQDDAARMLQLLSGRMHRVITGVCLLGAGFEDVNSETTAVHFCQLTETDIRDYIATGEPLDKAGAYAIQGEAARWIAKLEGDYSNVVGLPLEMVMRMLREHGCSNS